MSDETVGRTIEVLADGRAFRFEDAAFQDFDGSLYVRRAKSLYPDDPQRCNQKEVLAAFAVGKWNSARIVESGDPDLPTGVLRNVRWLSDDHGEYWVGDVYINDQKRYMTGSYNMDRAGKRGSRDEQESDMRSIYKVAA